VSGDALSYAGSFQNTTNVASLPASAADAAAAATAGNPTDSAASATLTDDLNERVSSQRFGDIPGVDAQGRGFVRKGNESFHTAAGSPPAGYDMEEGQYEEGDSEGRQCSVM
jgi:hypothetical protein